MDPKLGGVCQAIRMIISGLKEYDVENEVVSLDKTNATFLDDDPFPVHAVGEGKGPWSYNSNLIPWLTHNLARFDAIIVHGMWLYYGYGVRKALEAIGTPGVKLFVMPHGMLDPYFQKAPGRRVKALRNYVYWKLVENKLINGAHGLLFTCEEECRLAREPFRPYQPKREIVVGLGAEQPPGYTKLMSDAFRDKLPEIMSSPYLLFLSRIHEKKGVEMLLKGYAELTKKMAATKKDFPKLVVAGPGLDTNYGAEMKAMAYEKLGLNSSVFFPGMLMDDSKWGAFYGCEAFVLPSHQENFGIAVVEALGCGKPVLISNQVNIWREIKSGGGGLVESDTEEGTAKMLHNWLKFTAEEKAMFGRKALQCFKDFFSKGPAAKKFLEAMNSQ
jgi:glycosyltransferase involved in cell wall biosynthesis